MTITLEIPELLAAKLPKGKEQEILLGLLSYYDPEGDEIAAVEENVKACQEGLDAFERGEYMMAEDYIAQRLKEREKRKTATL
jgi:hypothetical protein